MTDRRLLELDWKTSLSAIVSLAMPRVCVVCGRPLLAAERQLCLRCLADMPLLRCAHQVRNPMADRYNALLEDGPYEYACALFYYTGEYRHISQALKYGRDFACGRHFGQMLGEVLAASPLFRDVDAVLPVPLHWMRRWRRGYNQAEIIARQVARVLGCPCDTKHLSRIRRTLSQTRVQGEGKTANVQGAFRAAGGITNCHHILLVDDVCTSASTLAACRKALRPCCAPTARISAATLAFVGN